MGSIALLEGNVKRGNAVTSFGWTFGPAGVALGLQVPLYLVAYMLVVNYSMYLVAYMLVVNYSMCRKGCLRDGNYIDISRRR